MEIDRRICVGLYSSPDSLAQEFEVSRRVIFNDRQFMIETLHTPIKFDRRHGGWYYTDKTFMLPTTMVTQGELMTFFISVEVTRRHVGTALEGSLWSAVYKISSSLQDPVAVDLEALHRHYTLATPAEPVWY